MASDADRLRAAAAECDRLADQASKQPPGYSWMVSHYRKTAALLRAVADEHETFAEWVGPAVMKDYDSATFNVALALADAILGGSDE